MLVSAGAWALLSKLKDTSGRPLIATGEHSPFNSYGTVQGGYLGGEVVGQTVIPSWAGVDNHMYLVKADDLLLLESSTFNLRYERGTGGHPLSDWESGGMRHRS